MSIAIHGLPVARGIAIGRAVVVRSGRADVAHYLVAPGQIEAEMQRMRRARDAVVQELQQLQQTMPPDMPGELAAVLDVHLMLLQDETLEAGVHHWIAERRYNAEWALVTQLEALSRQFDAMEDEYLRERKADLEQVAERILLRLQGADALGLDQQAAQAGTHGDEPLILVAHDLSPADMLHFRSGLFAGFVTDLGGKTSHTAIVARSMAIPAVVGARTASALVRQDDWLVVDGDAGVLIVDPSPMVREEYAYRQRQAELERGRLARLKNTPALTLDGERIELLANIEQPGDVEAALSFGAVGVGLYRTEFLFMGRQGRLPDEEEQYQAYRRAVEGMHGMPVTIRTVDVGADKPLDERQDSARLNPALGLRAIRWSLSEPAMFLTQLRAILRAAAHGRVQLLIPMLAHASEIRQTLALLDRARRQLDERGLAHGPLRLGAMVEVPAAALCVPLLLRHFDFLSIGTNDLIQYTLAIDRADEQVAHLYDPLHPAVLQLVAGVIAQCRAQGKGVTVCGEMAGDPELTRLLLGLGLRSFSMHPAQLLLVKQQLLRSDAGQLAAWAQQVLASEDPAALLAGR